MLYSIKASSKTFLSFPHFFFILSSFILSSSIIPTSFFHRFFLSPRAVRAFGCTLMMGLSFANVSIGERVGEI
jgi:hypothetical protein